jgi:hypothetical protein
MIEGVMSSISMGVLLSANVTESTKEEPLLVPLREGPSNLTSLIVDDKEVHGMYIKHMPIGYP